MWKKFEIESENVWTKVVLNDRKFSNMSDAEWDADDFEPPKATIGSTKALKVKKFVTESVDDSLYSE